MSVCSCKKAIPQEADDIKHVLTKPFHIVLIETFAKKLIDQIDWKMSFLNCNFDKLRENILFWLDKQSHDPAPPPLPA